MNTSIDITNNGIMLPTDPVSSFKSYLDNIISQDVETQKLFLNQQFTDIQYDSTDGSLYIIKTDPFIMKIIETVLNNFQIECMIVDTFADNEHYLIVYPEYTYVLEMEILDEVWKRGKFFDMYEASTRGRVRNSKKILKFTFDSKNRIFVNFYVNKKITNHSVNKFICETFHLNYDNKLISDYINGNINDIRPSNLRFSTKSEQTLRKQITDKIIIKYNSNNDILCKQKDCENICIKRSKYCETHRKGKTCLKENCTFIASSGYDFCKTHGGGKRCQKEGCKKSAYHSTNFCKKHGGGRRCQKEGCNTSASDGGNIKFCKKHGGGNRCKENGCINSAQNSTEYCKTHGGGYRCKHENCNKPAVDINFCITHGGNNCKEEGCKKCARSGSDFCVTHGGGICEIEGCTSGKKGSSDFCVLHGGGRRCKKEECITGARENTDFCTKHNGGLLKMYPERACKNCNYIYVIPSSKFTPFCFRCYCVLNPNIEIPRQYKIKEHLLGDELKSTFPDLKLVFDKVIDGGCSLRRPDIRIELFTHTIIIENDENGDNHPSLCDEKRNNELYEDLGFRPIVMIRINPDSYKDKNGVKKASCFKYSEKSQRLQINDENEWKHRISILVEKIDYYLNHIPEDIFIVDKLFFNGY